MADSEIRAGKVTSPGSHYSWELAFEVKSVASGSGSGDGDPTYAHSATGVTTFVPNAAVISPGIYLTASSSFDGTAGTWSVTYDGPAAPFGGYTVSGSAYKGTVSVEARFQGLRLYVMEGGALPRIMWDELHIYVNGAYETTLGPGFDLTGMGTGPNYVSVFGMPLDVSAACSAGRANRTSWSYDPCEPDNADGRDWAASITQTVSGGCRHREYPGGPWVSGPVTPYLGTVPSGSGCPFGLGSPSLPASSTYGTLMSNASSSTYAFAYAGKIARTQIDRMMCGPVVVYESDDHASIGPDPCTGEIGPVFQDHYRTSTTNSSNSGRIQLQPNFGPVLNRFREDYAKLLLRGPGFPQTKASLSRTCSETSGGVTTGGTYSSNPEVHPAMATILGLVRDGDHPVLDALDYPCYAPTQAGKSQSRSVSYSYPGVVIVSCPSPGAPPLVDCEDDDFVATWVCEDTTTFPDPEGASESASISFPTTVGTVANYQGHDEPIPRYLGTWGNPLWHLFDFRDDWYLQGDDAPWDLYWGPIGAQWAYHPALPAEERPHTRLHNIGSGYWDHAHTPVFGAYTGGYTWTGIGRFGVRDVAFPATVGLSVASAPMLSCPDDSCTITPGSGGISLAATGTDRRSPLGR
ncbi:hypothetical protein EON81_05435 [bacterium]|nr:MAG: hypothetical protein EON81_05435 [bacterium]